MIPAVATREGGRSAIRRRLAAALLAAVTLAVYLPAARNGFVSYDDPVYVTSNAHVLAGPTAACLRWSLTATDGGSWHPLTWWSHMLDAALYGPRPGGHHLTSALIHAVSAGALLLLLAGATGALAPALLAAALFALHPLHVESVAWVSERKDVLAGLLWMAALLSHVAWVRRPARAGYLRTLGIFALALAAKPMAVTLPLVLLGLDFWPLGRLRPDPRRAAAGLLLEKAPFLLLSAAAAAATMRTQLGAGAFEPLADVPAPFVATLLGTRLANAAYSAAWYLAKAVWPAGLAVFYPFPAHSLPAWGVAGALALLAAVTVAAVRARRGAPWLAAGWWWYLVTLLPVVGLVQVGGQARADRYTYLPLVGVFVMAAWSGRAAVAGRPGLRAGLALAAVAACAACAVLTVREIGFWRDSGTLFRRALAVTGENHLAHRVLGDDARARGAFVEAEQEYRAALALAPRSPGAHNRLGLALSAQGRLAEAVAEYRAAVRLGPAFAEAMSNLGVDLTALGELAEAEARLREALALAPGRAEIWCNLGDALARQGRAAEAAEAWRRALALDPGLAAARRRLERIGREGDGR
jgi:Tfp pilus assembly protein PilF